MKTAEKAHGVNVTTAFASRDNEAALADIVEHVGRKAWSEALYSGAERHIHLAAEDVRFDVARWISVAQAVWALGIDHDLQPAVNQLKDKIDDIGKLADHFKNLERRSLDGQPRRILAKLQLLFNDYLKVLRDQMRRLLRVQREGGPQPFDQCKAYGPFQSYKAAIGKNFPDVTNLTISRLITDNDIVPILNIEHRSNLSGQKMADIESNAHEAVAESAPQHVGFFAICFAHS
jgi:hypothetical protein